MSEAVSIFLRFALYLDLMLVFGLGLFGLYGDRRLLNLQPLLRLTACLGVLLSSASLLSMTQA